jgi:hypothetical protein
MASLDESLAAAASVVDYLGDWFDRAGLCCSLDPEVRDHLLTFEVGRGSREVAISVDVEELAISRATEGAIHRLAARVASRADGEMAKR